jgi:hypothetical protein
MSLKKNSRKTLKILLIIVVVLVAIRLALPYVVLYYANKTLSEMKGYRGHIDDIDLAIIRGAYKIDSIYLNKYDSATQKETPFFGAKLIDLSVEWQSLLHGSIVGELEFDEPVLRFTKDKVEPDKVKKDSSSFKDLLHDFMPLKVNRFEVKNGRIQYVDEFSKPPVDIQMKNTHIVALNLRNAYDSGSVLPASIIAKSELYDGTLEFSMKLNPLADQPTFDMNAKLQDMNLVKLNDFFKAYAKVDVNKGTFGMYTELAAKDGNFDGYVKPILKDIDVLGKEDRKDNILQKLWEGFAGAVGKVFENIPKDQVATKVPLKGKIKDPDANIWYSITHLLENAFIRAIQPSLDNDVNIASVDPQPEKKKTFLEKVFGKKDDNDDKKKDKKEDSNKKKTERKKDEKGR